MLRLQQSFRSKKYSVFIDNKIVLSANDDKRIQSIDSIKTYTYGTSNDLVFKKEEVKYNNIIKQYQND